MIWAQQTKSEAMLRTRRRRRRRRRACGLRLCACGNDVCWTHSNWKDQEVSAWGWANGAGKVPGRPGPSWVVACPSPAVFITAADSLATAPCGRQWLCVLSSEYTACVERTCQRVEQRGRTRTSRTIAHEPDKTWSAKNSPLRKTAGTKVSALCEFTPLEITEWRS